MGKTTGNTIHSNLAGIVVANGTSAVTAHAVSQYNVVAITGASNQPGGISPSTSGFVLTSNGVSALPTFQAVAGNISGPGSSTDRAIATWNGTGGTALFNNSTAKIDSTGRATNTIQPCFEMTYSGTAANQTGDGTQYTVVYDATTFDQNSNTNGSTTFTAPVAGKYFFCAYVTFSSLGAGHTSGTISIAKAASAFRILGEANYAQERDSGNLLTIGGSCILSLSASDAITVIVSVSNSTKTVGIGDGDNRGTFFSGYLIC